MGQPRSRHSGLGEAWLGRRPGTDHAKTGSKSGLRSLGPRAMKHLLPRPALHLPPACFPSKQNPTSCSTPLLGAPSQPRSQALDSSLSFPPAALPVFFAAPSRTAGSPSPLPTLMATALPTPSLPTSGPSNSSWGPAAHTPACYLKTLRPNPTNQPLGSRPKVKPSHPECSLWAPAPPHSPIASSPLRGTSP